MEIYQTESNIENIYISDRKIYKLIGEIIYTANQNFILYLLKFLQYF